MGPFSLPAWRILEFFCPVGSFLRNFYLYSLKYYAVYPKGGRGGVSPLSSFLFDRIAALVLTSVTSRVFPSLLLSIGKTLKNNPPVFEDTAHLYVCLFRYLSGLTLLPMILRGLRLKYQNIWFIGGRNEQLRAANVFYSSPANECMISPILYDQTEA